MTKIKRIIGAVTAAGLFSLSVNMQAQDNPPAAPPAAGAPVAPPVPPTLGQNPMMRRQMPFMPGPQMTFQRAIYTLKMTKAELQKGTNDFGGHRDSASAACDKAIAELTEAMKFAPTPTNAMTRSLNAQGRYPGQTVQPIPAPAPGAPATPPAPPAAPSNP